MAKPVEEVAKRIEDLLARAADPGASEEERRTCGVIAARLMREHGIRLAPMGPPPRSSEAPPPLPERVTLMLENARSVGEAVRVGADGLNKALGFDVFGFAQNLIRERVQQELQGAITAPPASRTRPRAKRRKARS